VASRCSLSPCRQRRPSYRLRKRTKWQALSEATARREAAAPAPAALLRQVIATGAPPSLARLPMTPEEVAASYEGAEPHAGGPGCDLDVPPPGLDDEG
jgi:hypothetical protein